MIGKQNFHISISIFFYLVKERFQTNSHCNNTNLKLLSLFMYILKRCNENRAKMETRFLTSF